MKVLLATIPLAFVLAAAACGQSDPVADNAGDAESINAVVNAANATAEAATAGANVAANSGMPILPEDAVAAAIPDQYRGRWGMVAADCTSTSGDNKGLMTIGDKTVRFYESVGTLKEQRPAKATSFSGLFGFTGEGQNWDSVMTFTRTGESLERAGEDGRFTYTKC